MSSEKDLAVSGIMFLTSLKSFEVFNQLSPGVLTTCDPTMRFGSSLILSILVVAMLASLTLSGVYFKKFLDSFSIK